MNLEQTTFMTCTKSGRSWKLELDLEQSKVTSEKSQLMGHCPFPSLAIIGVYAICIYLLVWM